ncbi:MAG: redoxin domain-containing protein [Pelobium sp.]
MPATLLRIAGAVHFERVWEKIYLTIPPNLLMPDLLRGSAVRNCSVDLQGWDFKSEGNLEFNGTTIGNGFSLPVNSALSVAGEMGEVYSLPLVASGAAESLFNLSIVFQRLSCVRSARVWLLFAEKSDKPFRRRMRRCKHVIQENLIVSNKYLNAGVFYFLKKLWSGYKERQRYRKEVQRRLLKQRALKRDKSLETGHWTDRLLKYKDLSIKYQVKSEKDQVGWAKDEGIRIKDLLALESLRLKASWCKVKLQFRSEFGMTKRRLEMTKWSYEMTKRRIAMTALLMVMCSINVKAQDTIRPLKIGDSLPDLTLEQVSNYTGNTLKLADLKGKLVILDFWATWCAPCVKLIPRLDSLQKVFKGQVQFITVAYESQADIAKFNAQLLKRGVTNNLLQVNGDQVLSLLFPHTYLPHEVWITPEGKVLAFTDESDLNEMNIRKALQQELFVKTKVDHQIEDDMEQPLFVNGIGGDGANLIYHRAFSPYVQGLRLRSISWVKPDGSTHIRATNTNLSRLYQVAFSGGGIDFTSYNRLKILVRDTSELIAPEERAAMLAWISKNTYCYEFMAPVNFKGKGFEEMKKDLSILFPQYTAGIEKQVVDCWVLKRTSSIDKMATTGGKELRDFNPIHFEIQNQPLRQLAGMLDMKYLSLQPYPVLDETGYKGNVDLNLDTNMTKVETINEALKAYDLALVKAKRTIDMLVIRDSGGSEK